MATKDLGLREFSHSAKTVLRALDGLFRQYEAEAPAHMGKVPVVTISGTETIKINSPQGELRFKVPEWSITEWIDRPKVMDGGAAAPSEPAPAAVSQPPAAAEPTVPTCSSAVAPGGVSPFVAGSINKGEREMFNE